MSTVISNFHQADKQSPTTTVINLGVGETEGKVVCCSCKQMRKKQTNKKGVGGVCFFCLTTNPNLGPKFQKYGTTKATRNYSGIDKHYCFFVHSK